MNIYQAKIILKENPKARISRTGWFSQDCLLRLTGDHFYKYRTSVEEMISSPVTNEDRFVTDYFLIVFSIKINILGYSFNFSLTKN